MRGLSCSRYLKPLNLHALALGGVRARSIYRQVKIELFFFKF